MRSSSHLTTIMAAFGLLEARGSTSLLTLAQMRILGDALEYLKFDASFDVKIDASYPAWELRAWNLAQAIIAEYDGTARPPEGVAGLPKTINERAQEAATSTSNEVHARFWVQKVTKQAVSQGNIQLQVELQPVIRASGLPGAEGNVDWSKYTPSGKIEMSITAEGAQEWFEAHLGKDVAITFSDVE